MVGNCVFNNISNYHSYLRNMWGLNHKREKYMLYEKKEKKSDFFIGQEEKGWSSFFHNTP